MHLIGLFLAFLSLAGRLAYAATDSSAEDIVRSLERIVLFSTQMSNDMESSFAKQSPEQMAVTIMDALQRVPDILDEVTKVVDGKLVSGESAQLEVCKTVKRLAEASSTTCDKVTAQAPAMKTVLARPGISDLLTPYVDGVRSLTSNGLKSCPRWADEFQKYVDHYGPSLDAVVAAYA